MIEFNFEYLGSFSEDQIKIIVKKSISEGLKEMDFKKKYYLSVLLTDNNGIKKINNKYRKINKSTNVLSFPQNDERFVTKKNIKDYPWRYSDILRKDYKGIQVTKKTVFWPFSPHGNT